MGATDDIRMHTTLQQREKNISVFILDENADEKRGEVDCVAVYDRAGNKLIDDLYADLPTIRKYEELLEKGHIPPKTEIRLGIFFECNYNTKDAKMHYLWYLKKGSGQIQLLTSPEMSAKMKQAEKENRLYFSGFDILRGRTLEGDRVEIEQNVNAIFKVERICKECGKRFTPDKHNRNEQKFCSKRCYRRNYYKTKGK